MLPFSKLSWGNCIGILALIWYVAKSQPVSQTVSPMSILQLLCSHEAHIFLPIVHREIRNYYVFCPHFSLIPNPISADNNSVNNNL